MTAERSLKRTLAGDVNGMNEVFRTPVPYVSGSVAVFLNGQLLEQDPPSGWQELGGTRVRVFPAPQPGDVVQAFFRYVV